MAEPARAAEPGPPAEVTLAGLVDVLTDQVIEVAHAPAGLDVPVRRVWIHDDAATGEPGSDAGAGDLVLAVGVDPSSRQAAELVTSVSLGGAAALVFKAGETVQLPVEPAMSSGIAVLRARPRLAWGQLYSLIQTALATPTSEGSPLLSEVSLGDLFALANAIAGLVGGATTIEDPRSRVLAYSNLEDTIDQARRETILGRRVPEDRVRRYREQGVFKALWSTEEVVAVPGDPDTGRRPRRAVAVRAGAAILGSIWVVEGRRRLRPGADQALREAAEVAALHLVRSQFASGVERRRRADLLSPALAGRAPFGSTLASLGFAPGRPVTVAALRPEHPSPAAALALTARLGDVLALVLDSHRMTWAASEVGGITYLVVSSPGEAGGRTALVDAVSRAEEALGVRVHCGIGSTSVDREQLPRAKWEAEAVLEVIRSDPSTRSVGDVAEHRSRALAGLVAELVKGDERFRHGVVYAVADHDRRHRTDYLTTLAAYVRAQGDIARASGTLGVHPNTLRYRLSRMSDLFGLDPSDPDERFVADLQLRLMDLDAGERAPVTGAGD